MACNYVVGHTYDTTPSSEFFSFLQKKILLNARAYGSYNSFASLFLASRVITKTDEASIKAKRA